MECREWSLADLVRRRDVVLRYGIGAEGMDTVSAGMAFGRNLIIYDLCKLKPRLKT